jgi:hypothetical protein
MYSTVHIMPRKTLAHEAFPIARMFSEWPLSDRHLFFVLSPACFLLTLGKGIFQRCQSEVERQHLQLPTPTKSGHVESGATSVPPGRCPTFLVAPLFFALAETKRSVHHAPCRTDSQSFLRQATAVSQHRG